MRYLLIVIMLIEGYIFIPEKKVAVAGYMSPCPFCNTDIPTESFVQKQKSTPTPTPKPTPVQKNTFKSGDHVVFVKQNSEYERNFCGKISNLENVSTRTDMDNYIYIEPCNDSYRFFVLEKYIKLGECKKSVSSSNITEAGTWSTHLTGVGKCGNDSNLLLTVPVPVKPTGETLLNQKIDIIYEKLEQIEKRLKLIDGKTIGGLITEKNY